jgi:hypothetical protein
MGSRRRARGRAAPQPPRAARSPPRRRGGRRSRARAASRPAGARTRGCSRSGPRRGPEVVGVVRGGQPGDRLHGRLVAREPRVELEPRVAALLAQIERVEDGGRLARGEAVGEAAAHRALHPHQRHHASWTSRRPAVVGRPLVEPPLVASHAGGAALLEGEAGAPEERAVTEDPEGHGASLRRRGGLAHARLLEAHTEPEPEPRALQ